MFYVILLNLKFSKYCFPFSDKIYCHVIINAAFLSTIFTAIKDEKSG